MSALVIYLTSEEGHKREKWGHKFRLTVASEDETGVILSFRHISDTLTFQGAMGCARHLTVTNIHDTIVNSTLKLFIISFPTFHPH